MNPLHHFTRGCATRGGRENSVRTGQARGGIQVQHNTKPFPGLLRVVFGRRAQTAIVLSHPVAPVDPTGSNK